MLVNKGVSSLCVATVFVSSTGSASSSASWLPSRTITRPPLRGASSSMRIQSARTSRLCGPLSIESPVTINKVLPPDQCDCASIMPADLRSVCAFSYIPCTSLMATTWLKWDRVSFSIWTMPGLAIKRLLSLFCVIGKAIMGLAGGFT